MADLNGADIAELKAELARLEVQLEEEKTTANALIRNQKQVIELERVYSKAYNRSNGIIVNYEKEITFLVGERIGAPLVETDLQEHARESGRLWQPTVSLDPKIITEMVGGGISGSTPGRYEQKDTGALLGLIEIIKEGGNGGVTYPSGNLFRDYEAGDLWFLVNNTNNIQPDAWYMISARTFVQVGTVTAIPARAGFCDGARGGDPGGFFPPYCPTSRWVPALAAHKKCTIKNRLDVPGLDFNENAGAGVSTWLGFSNTERLNKIATSVSQSVMNAMLSGMDTFADRIKNSVNTQVSVFDANEDRDKDLTARQNAVDFLADVDAYLVNKYIHDGPIDDFITVLQDREAYITIRYNAAHEAKKLYYPDRINYAKLRCNRQSGTIARALYLEDPLLDRYPEGGSPDLIARINKIKRLLQEAQS